MYFRGTISDVAGTKMSTDYPWSITPFPRRIRGISLTGGSAAGDSKVEVRAGRTLIATLYNVGTQAVVDVDQLVKCGLYVPANTPIFAKVTDVAAGSGSVYLHLDMVPSRVPVIGGEVFMKNVTAATAVLNYDFLDGEECKSAKINRILRYMGLIGSNAVGDTILELSVGNQLFSELYNNNTGLSLVCTTDLMPVTQFCAGGREVEAKVTDAASTNAVLLVLVFGGVAQRARRGFARRF